MKLIHLTALALAASVAFAPAAYADITIGLVAPLTGPVAAYGDQVKNGAQTAVDVINKNGGILGEQVVLKLTDDAGEPKQGVSAANQLVSDGVRFVVGPVTSGVSIPASDVFAENGVIMVTPTATAPDLTNRGLSNIFRTCGRDDQQAQVAANYVLEKLKDKKIAVVHDKGAYGLGLANSFKATLNAGGVNEVLFEGVNAGEKDYSALTTRMKADGVEVLFFGGYHPEAGLIARQLKDTGANIAIFGGEGLSNSEYWEIAAGGAANTIFTNASDATKNTDATAALEALKAANIPAEAFTLNAYAAVEVLKAGIEKAGSAEDTEAVAAALRSGDTFKTTIGDVTYGETGDLTSGAFSLFKWQDGKIVAAE